MYTPSPLRTDNCFALAFDDDMHFISKRPLCSHRRMSEIDKALIDHGIKRNAEKDVTDTINGTTLGILRLLSKKWNSAIWRHLHPEINVCCLLFKYTHSLPILTDFSYWSIALRVTKMSVRKELFHLFVWARFSSTVSILLQIRIDLGRSWLRSPLRQRCLSNFGLWTFSYSHPSLSSATTFAFVLIDVMILCDSNVIMMFSLSQNGIVKELRIMSKYRSLLSKLTFVNGTALKLILERLKQHDWRHFSSDCYSRYLVTIEEYHLNWRACYFESCTTREDFCSSLWSLSRIYEFISCTFPAKSIQQTLWKWMRKIVIHFGTVTIISIPESLFICQ